MYKSFPQRALYKFEDGKRTCVTKSRKFEDLDFPTKNPLGGEGSKIAQIALKAQNAGMRESFLQDTTFIMLPTHVRNIDEYVCEGTGNEQPKSVVFSLYQSYILMQDMYVYTQAVSGQ